MKTMHKLITVMSSPRRALWDKSRCLSDVTSCLLFCRVSATRLTPAAVSPVRDNFSVVMPGPIRASGVQIDITPANPNPSYNDKNSSRIVESTADDETAGHQTRQILEKKQIGAPGFTTNSLLVNMLWVIRDLLCVTMASIHLDMLGVTSSDLKNYFKRNSLSVQM